MRTAALLLALIAAAAAALALNGSRQPARAAPALPGNVLAGPRATVASLRGRPALIDFFASWCEPCAREAPVIERVSRVLGNRASVVAVDWSDSRSSARAFVSRFRWTFPVLADPNGAAGYRYDIQGLPTTFVLDSRGRIVERLLGPQTTSSLLRAAASATQGDQGVTVQTRDQGMGHRG